MLIVMAFLMSSDFVKSGRLRWDGHDECGVHRMTAGVGGARTGKREGGSGCKTVIAFHQVRPIFYSSLKQSNLQTDNYALAPFICWRESGARA